MLRKMEAAFDMLYSPSLRLGDMRAVLEACYGRALEIRVQLVGDSPTSLYACSFV